MNGKKQTRDRCGGRMMGEEKGREIRVPPFLGGTELLAGIGIDL